MSTTPEKPDASAQGRTASPPARWRTLLAGVALVLAALVVYHNSLDAPFLFDDTFAIVDNPTIRRLWPPWEVLSPSVEGGGATGRPLVNLSLAVNFALGGLDVRGYHAMNLALHILATLALWGVLRRTLVLLSGGSELARDSDPREQARSHSKSDTSRLPHENAGSMAWSAALVWTVHPLLTESVVCVVQRNEVMGGLFYLLTLYCFIRGVEVGRVSDPPSRPVKDRSYSTWFAVSVASCLLGMASKEIVATAPLLVLLHDRTFIAGTFREAWRRRGLFYGALAATWLPLAWFMWHSRQRGGTVGFGLGVSSWEYLLTQCRALTIYLKLSFWPHPLVVDYGMAVVRNPAEVWWQGLLVVALLLATIVALWRKPVVGFLGAWFFVILAPSSSFVPLITQTIAEHRMYLPLAAVIVLVVAGLHAPAGRRATAACLALAAGLGAITVRRGADYRDPLAFWTGAIAAQPDNARAHVNLGNVHTDREQWPEAIAQYDQALRLQPDDAAAHNNLGNALMAEGRLTGSMAEVEQALRLRPGFAEAEHNLGLVLTKAGRPAEAIPHFERAVRIRPAFAMALQNLAFALTRTGRIAEAIPLFERALQLKPDFALARHNLGIALAAAGRTVEALPHFEQAVRLKPDYARAELHWAVALMDLGRFSEAVPHLEKTIALDANAANAHLNLALVLRQLGRTEEATRHYDEARRLDPGLAARK